MSELDEGHYVSPSYKRAVVFDGRPRYIGKLSFTVVPTVNGHVVDIAFGQDVESSLVCRTCDYSISGSQVGPAIKAIGE